LSVWPAHIQRVEDLQCIHETAVRILAEIGLRTDHAGMRDRLAGLGCRLEGERVFFPPNW
jgi:trimethylamine:corrinoid methyltransferase-like protein